MQNYNKNGVKKHQPNKQFKPKQNNNSFKIEQEVVKLLKQNNYKICFAESMTGGLLASTIISVPGASQVLEQSFITYSNAAKYKILRVNHETIKEFGVVSEQVAKEMAEGLFDRTKYDVCVSTTGDANSGKLYVGYHIKNKNKTIVECYNLKGNDRNKNRSQAVTQILYKLALLLK